MSFFIALAAFAAIVSVYATVVTVIVEGFHKVFGLRSSGLNEAARVFYDDTLRELQPQNVSDEERVSSPNSKRGPSLGAQKFADQVCQVSEAGSPKFWYLRRWLIIGSLLKERKKTLSPIEFIENLAETPEGAALRHHGRAGLRRALTIAAYQFERIGDRQAEYFRARAKVLSVLVGIGVAFFANFDALTIYNSLATNTAMSARVSLAIDHQKLELLRASAQGDPGREVTSFLAGDNGWSSLATDVRDLGIPIGRKMYPYCEDYDPAEPTVTANAAHSKIYYDQRCGTERQLKINNEIWKKTFKEYRDGLGADKSWFVIDWLGYRTNRILAVRDNLSTVAMWLLGVLVGGGLLGLGAPFWFGVFSRLSSIATPAAARVVRNTPVVESKHVELAAQSDHSVRNHHPDKETQTADWYERAFARAYTSQHGGLISPMDAAEQLGSVHEAVPGHRYGDRPESDLEG